MSEIIKQYSLFQKNGGFFEISCGFLKFVGDKAAQLLNGQLTNDIKKLETGEGNYNLLLTNKGKVVADLYVFHSQDGHYALTDATFKNKIFDHFKKLAPLSKVQINDESDNNRLIHLCASKEKIISPFLFPGGSCKVFQLCSVNLDHIDVLCLRTDRLGLPGYDLLVSEEHKEDFTQMLEEQNFVSMKKELADVIRIEQGIPKVGQDVDESNLPQEGRLDHALNFDKGCYLGQEIIARLHYKGHVNRILVGLKLNQQEPVEPGVELFSEGNKVGYITTSIFSPKMNSAIALGYVSYKLNQKGQEFLLKNKEIRAEIVALPI